MEDVFGKTVDEEARCAQEPIFSLATSTAHSCMSQTKAMCSGLGNLLCLQFLKPEQHDSLSFRVDHLCLG